MKKAVYQKYLPFLILCMTVCVFCLFPELAYAVKEKCEVQKFEKEYLNTCYSCDIVTTLTSAFLKAGAVAYEVSRSAANVVLIVVTSIWVAIFVLQNVSSFSTVEPMEMLQALFVQFFKVIVAFVIINAGISTILHYTLEPIMLAGTDFGNAIMTNVPTSAEFNSAVYAKSGGGEK